MEKFIIYQPKYIHNDAVGNGIGEKGWNYLSKNMWVKLKGIYIRHTGITEAKRNKNNVGDRGCFWLKKTNWYELAQLYAGIFIFRR